MSWSFWLIRNAREAFLESTAKELPFPSNGPKKYIPPPASAALDTLYLVLSAEV